ncbi:peptidase domain-containing ABC transporter [Acinetobacter baumannii]|uniref:ATP-binding cassette domain-containing protein n=23 Tax=Acinetobacter baumannii TaxID=470 RepID=A0A3S0KUG0_ACIBA|nr:peptidase domain-containing ABC transporter [Acinetobacter baumannii]EHU1922151.1 peptidase domain-containing ABC transporter [Acinetobacter baumannii]EHU1986972.1 peptidase domain-containing ABC transporter [Acinetobacter baumannii]EHU2637443.1 peptidase domain-containing ABC transporter [Acinetobacter baumannii]EHU3100694.1 peptidase domain-containing ABC transporter [Acinetobacter baumannii]EHU3110849.1 peptidase domain-containing ABC transporter [Acinetobacter baumannii]
MSYIQNLVFTFRSKVPVILQTESSECGLACLAMISSYYGHYETIFTLRQKYSVSIKGSSLSDLIKIAGKINLNSRPLRLEMDELSKLRLPCIIHINMDHFVVLVSVNKKIEVIDPSLGKRFYSIDEFSDIFTGIALEIWPNSKFEKNEKKEIFNFFHLLHDLKSLLPSFSYILILAVVLEILGLVSPLYMQFVLDNVIPEGDRQLLLTLTIAFFMLMIFNIIITTTQTLIGMFVSTTLNVQWKSNVLNHLVNIPNEYFFKRHLGDIISRFNSIDPIQSTLTSTFIITLLNACLAIFTLCLMFYFSAQLALITLIAMVLYLLLKIITYLPLRSLAEKGIILGASQNSYLMETIRGIRAIKQYNKQDERSNNWLSLFVNQTNNSLSSQKLSVIISIINKFIFGVENLLIIWFGANLVIDKTFTIGFLTAFIAYKTQFSTRFSSLIDSYFQIKMLSLHGERLSDIVLTDQEDVTAFELTPNVKQEIKGQIKAENISFKYGDFEAEIIQGLNLTIEAGQSIALTGPSGCGKTTFLNLLNASLKPTSGEIFLDNIPFSQLGTKNLRSLIACVDQNDTLFAGNIIENISFFDSNVKLEWVERCAEMAGIHNEIIKMPMGYWSLVGDMGSSLSGGQKQRILIARALYQKPKILFMDEATSHLDIRKEKEINQMISDLKITRVIIAHRKETIMSADRVISLKEGKICFDKIK